MFTGYKFVKILLIHEYYSKFNSCIRMFVHTILLINAHEIIKMRVTYFANIKAWRMINLQVGYWYVFGFIVLIALELTNEFGLTTNTCMFSQHWAHFVWIKYNSEVDTSIKRLGWVQKRVYLIFYKEGDGYLLAVTSIVSENQCECKKDLIAILIKKKMRSFSRWPLNLSAFWTHDLLTSCYEVNSLYPHVSLCPKVEFESNFKSF